MFISFLIIAIIFAISTYVKCPPNSVIVVYDTQDKNNTMRCIKEGGTFVLPVIQNYNLLSLDLMSADIYLEGVLSKDKIRVTIFTTITFGISMDSKILQNAAKKLLGYTKREITNRVSDIITSELRIIVRSLPAETILQNKKEIIDQINSRINPKLNKIGIEIISSTIKNVVNKSENTDTNKKKANIENIISELDLINKNKEKALVENITNKLDSVDIKEEQKPIKNITNKSKNTHTSKEKTKNKTTNKISSIESDSNKCIEILINENNEIYIEET